MIITKNEWDAALAERHGKEYQKRFQRAVVAVCGLGGLGSNIAVVLARTGVGKLILIDYDRVDIGNLHRQQYKVTQTGWYKTEALAANIYEINPFIEIEYHTTCMTHKNASALLKQADIICEAFDDAEQKAMLTNYVLEKMPDRYLIAASGMAGFGDANRIQTRKITEHFYVCGDLTSDVNEEGSLTASRVMICAAHQAHAVLQILMKEGDKK